jgi:hypothetical protein
MKFDKAGGLQLFQIGVFDRLHGDRRLFNIGWNVLYAVFGKGRTAHGIWRKRRVRFYCQNGKDILGVER